MKPPWYWGLFAVQELRSNELQPLMVPVLVCLFLLVVLIMVLHCRADDPKQALQLPQSQSDVALFHPISSDWAKTRHTHSHRNTLTGGQQQPSGRVSSRFFARGMGLYRAQQFKEAEFFVYSTQDCVSFLNLEVVILGPFDSYCRTTVKKIYKKPQKVFVASPETIKVSAEVDGDRLRVIYVAQHSGIHEIWLNCNQESLQGSPFQVNVRKYCRNPDGWNSSPLKITKYLKELTNRQAIEPKSYSDFQKLVNKSFRIACKVTRASPVGGCFAQFSSSSPVCGWHIVPEDSRKLSERLKKDQCTSSLISEAESREEIDALRPLNAQKQEKPSRGPDGKNTLQRMVLERKLFWETMSDEAKLMPAGEILKSSSGSWNSRLRHVDSLYLLRKRPVSDCPSNLSRDEKRLKRRYQWLDDNMDVCSKVSLDQRLKTYLANAPSGGMC